MVLKLSSRINIFLQQKGQGMAIFSKKSKFTDMEKGIYSKSQLEFLLSLELDSTESREAFTYKEMRKVGQDQKRGEPLVVMVFNQKGGVGKTLTCFNLAAISHARGKNVTLIDIDGQANLSKLIKEVGENNVYNFIKGWRTRPDAYDAITDYATEIMEGFRLLGSGAENFNASSYLDRFFMRESAEDEGEFEANTEQFVSLFQKVKNSKEKNDIIIVDAGPSRGTLNQFFFSCADVLICPLNTDEFSYEGIEDLLESREFSEEVYGINNHCEIRFLINDRDQEEDLDAFIDSV
ncbi:AAA family ATPase, partial [Halobacteriovorax sp. ZH3_bin.1]